MVDTRHIHCIVMARCGLAGSDGLSSACACSVGRGLRCLNSGEDSSDDWSTTSLKRMSTKSQERQNVHVYKTRGNYQLPRHVNPQQIRNKSSRKNIGIMLATQCLNLANNSKRFWTFLKNRKTESSNIAVLKAHGIAAIDSKVKANILNEQFKSVYTNEVMPAPKY